jgi:hypothetical protein
MKTLLETWLADVVGDHIVIHPSARHEEAHANCWSFSMSSSDASQLSPGDLVAFVEAVVASRSAKLIDLGCSKRTMEFYCWFDEQACQLRFSLVSWSSLGLPFECRVRPVPTVLSIVDRFRRSLYHDGIPMNHLVAASFKSPDPEMSDLDVWSKLLP